MYAISEVFFTALEGLIFIVTFALLSNRREFIFKNYIKIITFVFIYTIYTYCLTLFIPRGFRSIIVAFFTVLMLNFLFNGNLSRSLLKIFFMLLSITIIEILISLFGMLIMNVTIGTLLQNNFYVFICTIITKFLEITAVLILYKSNFNIKIFNDSIPQNSNFRQLLIIISCVLFFMVSTNIYISNDTQNLFLFNIFSFVVYVVLITTVLMAFREWSKLELIQFASELKKENIQQLINFNEMVGKERHEFKNHLNTIYGLCTLNKTDLSSKIKQYINNYTNNSETSNITVDSGNDFVDAIINVKYNNGLRKGIEVSTKFEAPLSMAKIGETIIVTIVSNIIENAFESMMNVEKDSKFVQLHTYIENNLYCISISNNGPMISELDKKKIFNVGYSTKDNSAKTRGFGLNIVQTEISQCGGDIYINSTEEITEFLIALKINIQKAIV